MHTVFDNVDYGAALFILFLVWGFRVVVFFKSKKFLFNLWMMLDKNDDNLHGIWETIY